MTRAILLAHGNEPANRVTKRVVGCVPVAAIGRPVNLESIDSGLEEWLNRSRDRIALLISCELVDALLIKKVAGAFDVDCTSLGHTSTTGRQEGITVLFW